MPTSAPPPAAKPALILFGHGARDPRWKEPFERLHGLLCSLLPDTPVRLAFLELMCPHLEAAVEELVAAGCTHVTVVPVFFGRGGHLRQDLPMLIEQNRQRFPQLTLQMAEAVGENRDVLQAIAHYCASQLPTLPTR